MKKNESEPIELTNHEKHELRKILKAIKKENVSWGEIAYLQGHQNSVKMYGDTTLAEWAGIPEEEFNEDQEKIEQEKREYEEDKKWLRKIVK